MQAMMAKGSKLDMKDLKQQAAMPLSSFLRFDPWTDQLFVLHSAEEPLLSASDKMPFEVEPVYLKLGYYKPPVDTSVDPAAPNAAPPNAAPNAAPPADNTAAPAAAPPASATPPTTTPQN
jgi:hypothetical protein